MKILKELSDIEINGITLLSNEEYENVRESVPLKSGFWWLRSPGLFDEKCAMIVQGDGNVVATGLDVYEKHGVRPVLLLNPSPELKVEDVFRALDHSWTVITENMAICNDYIVM